MKKKVVYVCEHCEKEFDNLADCLDCECGHVCLSNCIFSHDVYKSGERFPEKTIITSSDGECAIYERTTYVKDNVVMDLVNKLKSSDNVEALEEAKKNLLEYIEYFM